MDQKPSAGSDTTRNALSEGGRRRVVPANVASNPFRQRYAAALARHDLSASDERRDAAAQRQTVAALLIRRGIVDVDAAADVYVDAYALSRDEARAYIG